MEKTADDDGRDGSSNWFTGAGSEAGFLCIKKMMLPR
jgi:hypothetical protein